MRELTRRFGRYYGAHPLHLLTMLAGLALVGYIVATFKIATLWNPGTWWQSIAVWFAAAVIGHDLVAFPVYSLVDRIFAVRWGRARSGSREVSVRNYLRIPAMGSALTLLIFLPGIIEQGASTYHAATGETQEPFLGRWLLLTAVMFALSAATYAVRLVLARRRRVSEVQLSR
ncbi:hypothetical protein DAVIS_01134 [Mycobacterium marinum]|uniref:Uncharacterized protein n=1 Tax=Mycobacterium marinum TaxID=1781 RepID=A0A3E2MZW6_MYCMR|nr:hypothetical protein [Mycobacterium marinum]RFZ45304.1 hypothetical protein DAVIS_01134 [Mycobacterium marinum]